MAKEDFTKEMNDKSIEIAMKLTDVLVDEGYSATFMMYCVARFTAGLLSSLQRFCTDVDLATEYTAYVKKMMKEMDARVEAEAASNQTKEDKEESGTQYLSETDILKILMRQVDGKGS